MKRFFISHAPRFGSYANPIRTRVEQSPYYWWWYALTLNDDYRQLCSAQPQRASTSGDSRKPQSNMLKVYKDFGDVRYEGDRYRAFCAWWRNRVNTNEERGAYLFAEPLRGYWTRVVSDSDEAAALAEADDQILITVPKNQMRLNAAKGTAKLIAKHIPENKGRASKDPRSSNARYHLNTAVHLNKLKLAFDTWDHRNGSAVDEIPQRISKNLPTNVRIAHAVGLQYTPQRSEDYSKADEHRTLSTQVSRYLRSATDMVNSAGTGAFP